MGLETAAIDATTQGMKALINSVLAFSQFGQARRLARDTHRPTETIPQGVLDATAVAKLLASMGMPAEQYSKALQEIDRSGTKAVAEARDRHSGLDVIGTSEQASNDAILGLNAEDARLRIGNMQGLIGQLNTLGNWQDKIWDYNSKQKYEENAAAIRALRTGAYANLGSAFNSTLSAGANAATLSGNQNATTTDPTINNPDLYDDGIPKGFMEYLQKFSSSQTHP